MFGPFLDKRLAVEANVKFTGSASDPVERRIISYVLSLSDSIKRHYRLDDRYEEDGNEDAL